MRTVNAIPVSYIRECLRADNEGHLWWLERPLHHFANVRYQATWNKRYAGTLAGSPVDDGHLRVMLTLCGARRFLLAHRIIWALHHGEWPRCQIDHKDRDPSNNRMGNLRYATHSQNGQNRGPSKHNTSGYKGVSRNRGRWMASIRIGGRKVNLGRFDDPAEAHNAYVAAAKQHHGEFACAG